MKISKQIRRDAKQLFRSCQSNGLLDENRVRQAVQAVLAQKPRGYVGILQHLQRLVKLDLDKRTACVDSPVALSPEQQSAVKGNLERKYGAGLNINFGEDPGLIGGLRVRVGSDVYDGSVRARLKELEASL